MQDVKQLQELLKEAIQHIRNIEWSTEALYAGPGSDKFYKALIEASKFADLSLRFATLEVKPHE